MQGCVVAVAKAGSRALVVRVLAPQVLGWSLLAPNSTIKGIKPFEKHNNIPYKGPKMPEANLQPGTEVLLARCVW